MSRSRRASLAELATRLRWIYGDEIGDARLAQITADAAIWNRMGRASA